MRETWSLVAQTSAARFYWLLASLLTTVITARYLGPDGRGLYVAAVGWVTLFGTLGNLSLSQVIIYLAAGRPAEEWLSPVVGSALFIAGIASALGLIVAATLYGVTGGGAFHNLSAGVLVFAFLALPFFLWLENGNGTLMALGKLSMMNWSQIIGATAALLLAFLAVGVARLGVKGALVAMALAQAITVVVALAAILRTAGGLRVEVSVVRQLLGGGAKLHLNAVGTYLFTQANVLILNHYRNPKETAFFQLAVQLMTGMQIVPTAISAVCYAIVSKRGPNEAWPEHRKLLGSAVALMIVLSVVAYFAAPFAVRLVFGADFTPAVPLFRILLLGTAGMTMSMVMASQWIARGLFLQAALLTLLIGCLTVAGNYFAVPRYGAQGGAWVTVGTYGLSIIGNGVMALWVQSRFRAHQRNGATAS